MNLIPLLPAAATVAMAAAGYAGRRLRPSLAVPALAGLGAVVAAAAVAALGLTAVSASTRLHLLTDALGWCNHLVAQWTPAWVGVASVAALTAIAVSMIRTFLRHRRVRPVADGPSVIVLPFQSPLAYSVAGRPGQVVVSSGMLDLLDCDERRVLFAHEQSHLRHHHHRYLLIADLAVSLPFLRPLRARMRFAVERWADEDAAAQVGSRQLVAQAIIRAALAQHEQPPSGALALAGCGVVDRVDALLSGSAGTAGRIGPALSAGVGAFALSIAAICFLAGHLCGL